jgi:hypothetical protein
LSVRAILAFLSPISLSFEDWLDWRDRKVLALHAGAVTTGRGAPLEALTQHDTGDDWRHSLAEVFEKSRRNEGVLAPLANTAAALARQMSDALSPGLETECWTRLVASRHDGPCLVFAVCLRGSSEAFAELDPRMVRAQFNDSILKSRLPWRADCEALGLTLPKGATIATCR